MARTTGIDRIADIWGARTPHRRGPAGRSGSTAPRRRRGGGRRRAVGAVGVRVVQQRVRATSPSRTAGWSASAAGPRTSSTTAGWGRRACTAAWPWTRAADRLTRPLVREDGRLVETDWDTAMGRIVERVAAAAGRAGPAVARLLHQRPAVPGGVLHAGGDRQGGLGTPHMDGNTRLCTATAAAAMKETLRLRRAARLATPTSTTATRSSCSATTWPRPRPCCGCGSWTARRAGPAADRRASTRARPRSPRRPSAPAACTSRRAAGHEPGADERADPGAVRRRLGRRRRASRAHTLGFDELRATVEPYTPERGRARSAAIDADDLRAGGARSSATSRAGAVDRAAGLLPVAPGDRGVVRGATTCTCCAGMIGRPGCGDPADERPADRAEHPRVRRRRRPARLPQLGQPATTSPSWPRLWNVDPLIIPHWAPPTHAMQIFRYAEQGSIGLLWISATNPAVSMPELGPDPARSSAATSASSSCRTCSCTETAELADVVLPAAGWGEKTGTLHQRQPHRPPVREGRRPARRGAQRPRHLPRLRPADGLPRQGRRSR